MTKQKNKKMAKQKINSMPKKRAIKRFLTKYVGHWIKVGWDDGDPNWGIIIERGEDGKDARVLLLWELKNKTWEKLHSIHRGILWVDLCQVIDMKETMTEFK